MLDLFAERDMGATWATVGFVFCGSKDELMEARPRLLPHYADPRLSPYDFSSIGKDENADPYSFRQSLVQKIKQYDRQEIGTHTLSHSGSLRRRPRRSEGDGGAQWRDAEEHRLSAQPGLPRWSSDRARTRSDRVSRQSARLVQSRLSRGRADLTEAGVPARRYFLPMPGRQVAHRKRSRC